MAPIEEKALTLPADTVIMVDSTAQYFYLYDDGELLRDLVNCIYYGKRIDFIQTIEEAQCYAK